MNPYGIGTSFQYTGNEGRCSDRACPYPGYFFNLWNRWANTKTLQCMCWKHFLIGTVPFSLEYEEADCLVVMHQNKVKRSANSSKETSKTATTEPIITSTEDHQTNNSPSAEYLSAMAYFEKREERRKKAIERNKSFEVFDEVLGEEVIDPITEPITDWELIALASFANRRAWGEKTGREWKDTSMGVQNHMHRWKRGGVNRKR